MVKIDRDRIKKKKKNYMYLRFPDDKHIDAYMYRHIYIGRAATIWCYLFLSDNTYFTQCYTSRKHD